MEPKNSRVNPPFSLLERHLGNDPEKIAEVRARIAEDERREAILNRARICAGTKQQTRGDRRRRQEARDERRAERFLEALDRRPELADVLLKVLERRAKEGKK